MNSNDEKQKDLEYFKKLQYEVGVKRRKGEFIVFIPELSIIEKDGSLEKAYGKLEFEKEKYFQEMIESDNQEYIKEPKSGKGNKIEKQFITNLVPFFVKTLTILLIMLFISVVAYNKMGESIDSKTRSLASDLENKLNTIPQKVALNVYGSALHYLNKLNGLPDERKEAFRLHLREGLKQIKPFVSEFKVLFKDIPTEESEK